MQRLNSFNMNLIKCNNHYYCLISTTGLLLLLLLLSLLSSSESEVGRGGSEVKFLPGFEGQLPFDLETGYVGVDEGDNVQLFYYFVKSSSDQTDVPLILWLEGGPGCSALTGLFYEIGPIFIDEGEDGGLPRLSLNPYAWTKVANIIFVDLPVGTGFSYARTPDATHSTGLQSCQHAYQFLQKWLINHHEFISNPFYIGGHSYIGITLPVIAKLISDGNDKGIEPHINIKGYLLGNGLTFREEGNYKIPFAHGMGLISDELYESLKHNCRGEYMNVDSSNLPCLQDVQTFDRLVDGLFETHIIDSTCDSTNKRSHSSRHRELYDKKQLYALRCYTYRHKFLSRWANDPSVQEALRVQKGSIVTWVRCNRSLPYTNRMWDSTPYHAYLSTKGYRSLIYSGDHDMSVPFLSTQAWIRSLNYSIIDDWRQWLVKGQIAGYTRTYANNMTFATIKAGAHISPESNPEECVAMFQRWISYRPL